MQAMLFAIFLMSVLAYGEAPQEHATRIVLPNPKLLKCKSSDCSQLWLGKSDQVDAVFPKQVIMDMNQSCLYGMTVLYDRSVALDDISAAINEHFEKWAVTPANSPQRLWRVEPDGFAIQLGVADKKDTKIRATEPETKQVVFIAFGGSSACKIP